jgi:signal recognition particle receptor subunit beta
MLMIVRCFHIDQTDILIVCSLFDLMSVDPVNSVRELLLHVGLLTYQSVFLNSQ